MLWLQSDEILNCQKIKLGGNSKEQTKERNRGEFGLSLQSVHLKLTDRADHRLDGMPNGKNVIFIYMEKSPDGKYRKNRKAF